MIGIAIAAVSIAKDTARRCYRSLADARIAVPYRVHIQTDCQGGFSRSAARNHAILALIPHCEQIICLDVDCLVPPGLIEYAAQNIRDGQAVWTLVRKIKGFDGAYCWDQWRKLHPWPWGTGAFVGMTTADWLLVGGWDERITTWGSEDDILALRRKEHGIRTIKVTDYPLVHVEHEYRGRNLQQAKANRELGSIPPPCNYLTNRLPLDAHSHVLYLWPTGLCQASCPQCSQQALMARAQCYQMTPDEIGKLIEALRRSGYPPFRQIIVAGGESFLWAHLVEGLQMLREARLGPVEVYTNALALSKIEAAIGLIDTLRISLYDWNRPQVEELRTRYGKKCRVVDCRRHWRLPTGRYGDEVLPADCVGPGYLLYDGHLYPCCNGPATPLGLGTPLEEVPRCRVQPGFVELLAGLRESMAPFCRACVGNRKLRAWLEGLRA